MARPGWVAPLFTFTTLPVSILTIVTFVAVLFSTIFFYEGLPHVPGPNKQHGLNLDEAYRDLQLITARPHPYNSHQNDAVRAFILERLTNITKDYSNIQIDDDQISNFTIAHEGDTIGSYFEGNNLLVHIQGTSAMPAVLFSAHFDSVSTAPGATDDGMGVVTLLQLVQYFAKNRPKRDVIFNINNAEEDGLYGALAFMEHPWALKASSFLNLEGAGGGGRALLFRTSSVSLAKAFWTAPHPHGNVLTENAFQRGTVRSDTDFTVYTKFGIPGIDIAFYKRRAVYHTKDDSIPTLAGKAALWNMLESAFFSGRTLTSDGNLDDKDDRKAVYFDLFGESLVVASLRAFFVIDVVLLIVGPILVAIMIFFAIRRSKMYWTKRGWLRFPIALILSAGVPIALAFLVNWVNPFVVYDSPYSVFVMQLSAACACLYLPLRLLAHYRPIFRQKTIILFELYILTWVLLVLNTILVSRPQIGGFYAITFMHASFLVSFLLGLSEHFELPPSVKMRLVRHIRRDSRGHEQEEEVSHEATERTPLLDQGEEEVRDLLVDEENQYALWIFQFLLAAPFSMILFTQINLLLLGALRNTLADGDSPLTVYLAVGLLSFFTALPLAPFTHKLHRSLFGLSLVIFVVSALVTIFAFPFSQTSPLKVYFKQTVDLDSGVNKVLLAGVSPFLQQSIIPELPSAADQEVTCMPGLKHRQGLLECSWAGKPPAVAPKSPRHWLKTKTSLVRPGYGRIVVQGIDTRHCDVYFDTPINNIHVNGSSGHFLEHYPMRAEGLTQVHLWSRSFDREFQLDFGWDGDKHITGKVGCSWDEKVTGRIPALDEVIDFLPAWATVTKYSAGLVEATGKFSI